MFKNKNNLNLAQGKVDSEGREVDINEVILPPWSGNDSSNSAIVLRTFFITVKAFEFGVWFISITTAFWPLNWALNWYVSAPYSTFPISFKRTIDPFGLLATTILSGMKCAVDYYAKPISRDKYKSILDKYYYSQ